MAVLPLAVALEWTRALVERDPRLGVAALLAGGVALATLGLLFRAHELGLSTGGLAFKLAGGVAMGLLLFLPAYVRGGLVHLPPAYALAAVAVSVGEEVAFRGAVFAVLEELGGAPMAVLGSSLLFAAGHALSHPPSFLLAVLAAGLLLGTWRAVCRDLVGPCAAHMLADLLL